MKILFFLFVPFFTLLAVENEFQYLRFFHFLLHFFMIFFIVIFFFTRGAGPPEARGPKLKLFKPICDPA